MSEKACGRHKNRKKSTGNKRRRRVGRREGKGGRFTGQKPKHNFCRKPPLKERGRGLTGRKNGVRRKGRENKWEKKTGIDRGKRTGGGEKTTARNR